MPFFKNFHPDLVIHSLLSHALSLAAGFLPFLLFVVLVMVGSSNAVNLTDGLDGLAIGCVVVAAGALTVLTYVTSHAASAPISTSSICRRSASSRFFAARWSGASLGISLVQRASRRSFHGRRRLAGAGRRDRH